MRTGYMLLFQNAHQGMSDGEMVRHEMRIAELAEPLGFDTIWSAEHHFDSYSMLPDNLQVLTYLAGRTSRIHLGTAAVILPWNNPLRVAEHAATLDHLLGGRLNVAFVRGYQARWFENYAAVPGARATGPWNRKGVDDARNRELFPPAAWKSEIDFPAITEERRRPRWKLKFEVS